MAKSDASQVLSIDGRRVQITHPEKLYFSQARISKLDLVRYYLSVAPGALAGIRDRPIVLKRFVNGAEEPAFYQKRAPAQRPSWLRTVTLSFPSGRTAEEMVVDDAAGLAWIVNLGCIELHPHPVRSADLDHPNELRIDLDPVPGVSWDHVRRVALEVKAFLDEVGLLILSLCNSYSPYSQVVRSTPQMASMLPSGVAVSLIRNMVTIVNTLKIIKKGIQKLSGCLLFALLYLWPIKHHCFC